MNAAPVGLDAALTIFVYFRTAPGAQAQAEAAMRRHLALVRARLGLAGRHGLRHDEHKPYRTWLEVYEGVRVSALEPTLAALDRASTDSGLAALAPEGRHVEVFELPAAPG